MSRQASRWTYWPCRSRPVVISFANDLMGLVAAPSGSRVHARLEFAPPRLEALLKIARLIGRARGGCDAASGALLVSRTLHAKTSAPGSAWAAWPPWSSRLRSSCGRGPRLAVSSTTTTRGGLDDRTTARATRRSSHSAQSFSRRPSSVAAARRAVARRVAPLAIIVTSVVFGFWHVPPALSDASGRSRRAAVGVVAGTCGHDRCRHVLRGGFASGRGVCCADPRAHRTNSFAYVGALGRPPALVMAVVHRARLCSSPR